MKPKRLLWAAGLMLMLVLAGCVSQTRDVKLYRDVLDATVNEPDIVFIPEDPLTLKQALLLANAHNEHLAMAGEDYLQSLINKDRAFSAFLPKIYFTAAFMRQEQTQLGSGNLLLAEIVPDKTTNLPVTGTMDVNLLRDVATYKAAGHSIQMQQATLLDQQSLLMLNVARAYFQVLYSERQVKVLEHTIKFSEKRLADMRVKQKAGMARHVDVLLTESQLAKNRAELIQAQNDIKNSRALLAFLINVPEINSPLTNGMTIPETDWQFEQLMASAEAHRQDLAAAHEQVKVAAAALDAAWGRYFPSVSLNLTRYISRDSFPSDVDWTTLIQVNVPIFSAGLIHADVRSAYSKLRQARLFESNKHRQVVKDLRVVMDNLRKDSEVIEQLSIQVTAAQAGLRAAEMEYNAGLGTNLQRLSAQQTLLTANLSLTTAQFSQDIDYLRLLRMTGSLGPDLSRLLPSKENNGNPTIK